jgi:16S rRNA G1207 methylase RsmC
MKLKSFIVNYKNVYNCFNDSSTLFFIKSLPKLPKSINKILDMGCGSGGLGIYYKLNNNKLNVTFADIKKCAIENAKENLKRNKLKGKCILTNLFNNISEKYDAIIFNIPYDHFSKKYNLNQYDYKGKIFKKFITKVKEFLNKNGKVFFTFSNLSKKDLLSIVKFKYKILNTKSVSKSETRMLIQATL